jgi:DNA-binding transcriptional regulator YiaG
MDESQVRQKSLVNQSGSLRHFVNCGESAMKQAQPITMSGEELRAIRLALAVGQARFARWLGKHVVTISNYERNVWPIPETVAKLAHTLMPPEARQTTEAPTRGGRLTPEKWREHPLWEAGHDCPVILGASELTA